MKITASLLSVFVGVGISVGVASAGDYGIRSTDKRILQDSSPEMEAGNGDVTTGADISGGSDGNQDANDCDSIADAICNLGDQYSTMCDIVKNETSMSSMDFGTKKYTVFIPDDTAWTLFQPSLAGLSDKEVGRIVSFHFYEGIDVTYDELDCGETLTAVNGDTSRTKCDQGHGDDIKHQNGNGNTIQESLPTITNSDIDFCQGVAHTIDHLMLPVHLEEFVISGTDDSDSDAGSDSDTKEEEITTLQGKKIFTIYLDLAPPAFAGMNYIMALLGSAVGPRLNATVVPPSADWLLLKPDGIIAINVKLLLKTDDGEYIHQTVTGRSVRDPENPSSSTIRTLALFETSSDKYKWLGHTALFGIGTKEGNKITVDYYDTLL